MESTAMHHLLYLFLVPLLCNVTPVLCSRQHGRVPALYIFGDDSVDVGNNNYLPTMLKSNHSPYGRDWHGFGQATGRFSNGKLFVDYLAEYLGLPYPPPFLESQEPKLRGVNFASAGSGVLNMTASTLDVAPLLEQLQWYQEHQYDLIAWAGEAWASSILGNAVYLISTGSNDFSNTYLLNSAFRAQVNEEQFEDLLFGQLESFIQKLFRAGARKIMVVSFRPLRCDPSQFLMDNSSYSDCQGPNHILPRKYNDELKRRTSLINSSLLIENSGSDLPGYVVYGNIYDHVYAFLSNTTAHAAFRVRDYACCGPMGPDNTFLTFLDCNEYTSTICSNADDFIYWDSLHYTQRVQEFLANKLWNGTSGVDCSPFCIQKLAASP